MQIKNWNDLRYLLALQRGRNISRAARLMGVDDTTVSRRLAVLQSATSQPLYTRRPDGSMLLTSKGKDLALKVEAMEQQVDRIEEALGSDERACAGVVRLTSVPIFINRVLTPKLGNLLVQYPNLEIELIPDSRDLSLTQREADIAVRLARPTTGGRKIKTRRIGQLDYSVYASREYSSHQATKLPWITYEDAMAHILQAQWLDRAAGRTNRNISGLRVHDGETALEAVAAGYGRSLLPNVIADGIKGLRKLKNDTEMSLPSRELWLLVHADQLVLRRIKVVVSWIESLINQSRRK